MMSLTLPSKGISRQADFVDDFTHTQRESDENDDESLYEMLERLEENEARVLEGNQEFRRELLTTRRLVFKQKSFCWKLLI